MKRRTAADTSLAEGWFAARGWQPFDFQRRVWGAMQAGESGLLHATTGSGKTYAVWFGALLRGLGATAEAAATAAGRPAPRLGVLWITPMRALAADTVRALQAPLDELGADWSIGQRTGDTAPADRARQDRRFPTALVTTPESLSLMLTREHAHDELASVHTCVFRTIVTDRFGSVTAEFGNVIGHFGDVTDGHLVPA